MIARSRRRSLLVVLLIACLSIGGCGDLMGQDEDVDPPNTLRLLAGSEIADLEPVLQAAEQATGVRVKATYTGTLEGAEKVARGDTENIDGMWYSSNRYLSVLPDASDRVATSTKIMASPVTLGVRTSVAQRLGWTTQQPSWSEIRDAVVNESLTFGMTDPSASNSGFSALVSIATALDGSGAALNEDRLNAVGEKLKPFFAGQKVTSGSSGWLAERYIAVQDTSPVDALINYESVLLEMNNSGKLAEPLFVVYPRDGVISADYPLTLLRSASEEKRGLFDKLVTWLKTPEAQQLIQQRTSRRPLSPGVTLDPKFGNATLFEQPFPAQRATVDGLVSLYLQKVRRPSQTVYVLDISGSMRGGRLDQLRDAMKDLATAENAATSFTAFRDRETVVLVTFSSDVNEVTNVTIDPDTGNIQRQQLQGTIDGLRAGGDTALYSALQSAYDIAEREVSKRPDAFTSVVLLTDGRSTAGISVDDFEQHIRSKDQTVQNIPTFAILFGEANPGDLERVAKATNGRVFNGEKDLTLVFRQIRGYQ